MEVRLKKFILVSYISISLIFFGKYLALTLYPQHSKISSAFNNAKIYQIYIFLDEHLLYLFENDKLIKSYPIAVGTLKNPSHVGIWKIANKSDWGEGFGGTWMGFNIPWGEYGIHGTLNPETIGDHATHGCIRMFSENAKELASIIPIGTPILISGGPYGAFGETPRTIMPGDRGSDVLQIQMRLKALGFYKEPLNAIYTNALKNSIFEFQKFKKLKPHNDLERWDLKVLGLGWFE